MSDELGEVLIGVLQGVPRRLPHFDDVIPKVLEEDSFFINDVPHVVHGTV